MRPHGANKAATNDVYRGGTLRARHLYPAAEKNEPICATRRLEQQGSPSRGASTLEADTGLTGAGRRFDYVSHVPLDQENAGRSDL